MVIFLKSSLYYYSFSGGPVNVARGYECVASEVGQTKGLHKPSSFTATNLTKFMATMTQV